MSDTNENTLLAQIDTIAKGLSETFAPFCEVVVHDLKKPEHSILSIHNNLSGRQVGEPTTELGLARIESADFPNIVANYTNQFSDGRPVKSTSIGIKNDSGEYVAALCLNLDMTFFGACKVCCRNLSRLEIAQSKSILSPMGLKLFAIESISMPQHLQQHRGH